MKSTTQAIAISNRDAHILDGVAGWLMLGNPAEAAAELEKLSPAARRLPDTLELEWGIHAQARDWSAALMAARTLLEQTPDRSFGWIHQAYALRRAPGGGLQAAWDALSPAAVRFPKVPLIPYNLACYAAQMGRTEEAWELLQKALTVSENPGEIRKMALADDDLKDLWTKIANAK